MRQARRTSMSALAAVAAAVVLGACGSSTSNGASAGSSTAGAQPSVGDAVTVGLGTLPTSQGNPYGATYAGPAGETWAAIFDGLTTVDAKSGPQPALATSWTQTAPDTWRFTLRKGVTFSDGEPFNAAAVAATVTWISTSPGSESAIGGTFTMLSGATAVDDYTVDIKTKTPDPILPRELVQLNIVAPDAWKTEGPDGFATKPVGTGPYQVTSWGPSSVQLTRFTKSWRPAHYKNLTIEQIPDQTSRFQALESDQIQVDYDLSLEQLTSAASKPDITLATESSGKVLALQFISKPGSPLTNPKVRLAMTEAIDRQKLVKALFGELTQPANQGAAPGTNGYNDHLGQIPYDPAGAKKLLAEAGYAKGFSLEADVTAGSVPGDTETFQTVAAGLGAIGVNVKFVTLPYATWLKDFLAAKFPGDMTSIAYSGAPAFDALLPLSRSSCLQKPSALWCVQSQADLLTKAAGENDPAARTALLQQVQAAEAQDPPALFLFNMLNSIASSKSVSVAQTSIGAIDFAGLAPA